MTVDTHRRWRSLDPEQLAIAEDLHVRVETLRADDPELTLTEAVTKVANDITFQIGSWGLGQLGNDGLADVVADYYEPYWRLDGIQQRAWVNAVRVELGWEPQS